jgi:hypothetical protein
VRDLYNENYKTLRKEIDENIRGLKDLPCLLIGKISIVKMTTTKKNIQI